MRLKFLASAVAAILAVFGANTAAKADGCGGCGASAVVACAPAADACCHTPRVRYKTEWQTVTEQRTRTCYKTVSETVMKEVREVVCKPIHETKEVECKRIVCDTVWEEKQVKVCCGEWVTEQRQDPCHTVCKRVRVHNCGCDSGCGHASDCGSCNSGCNSCNDPCAHKCGFNFGERLRNLFPQYTYVQETVPGRTYCVKTWKPREEMRTVKVAKQVSREVVEKKLVTTCRYERQEVVKQVPCTVCKKVPYCETYNVCRKVAVKVPVCDSGCHTSLFGGFKGLFHRSCGCDHGCSTGCSSCGGAPVNLAPAAPAASAPMPNAATPK